MNSRQKTVDSHPAHAVFTRPSRNSREVAYVVRKPVWRDVEQEYTVCVPRQVTKTATRRVCKTVWKDVEQTYTVYEARTETRTATRCVCKCVPVTRTYTVCEDLGKWECQTDANGCTQNVWVANLVNREVEYTAYERQTENVEYEYNVTVCDPVEKDPHRARSANGSPKIRSTSTQSANTNGRQKPVRTRCAIGTTEEKTRTVNYTVCVPKQVTEEYEVTVCEWVPVEKEQTYTVCTPYTVDEESRRAGLQDGRADKNLPRPDLQPLL